MGEPITPEDLRWWGDEYCKEGRLIASGKLYDAAAEIERLQSALDAAPVREEREGKCWCVEGDRCEIRTADNASYWVRRMLSLGHPGGDTYPPEDAEWHEWEEESEFCCNCGAHLGADGIARRWRERGGK